MEKGFKALQVWRRSYELVAEIYMTTRSFPTFECFGITSQMKRAAVSIIGNIAEGYERAYRKEYVRFLSTAKGSLGELGAYFLLARDIGYLDPPAYKSIEMKRKEVIKMLIGLMRSLKT